MIVLIVISCSCLISWWTLSSLIPKLRHQLLDQPNDRSSHLQATPSGGGLVFVGVSSVISIIALLSGDSSPVSVFPLLAVPLAVVGLIDDRHNLPASWRYGCHLFTAALFLSLSPLVQGAGSSIASVSWARLAALLCLLIVFTAVINFINFMDGLDGLVGASMSVAITCLLYSLNSSWPLWTLVGSLLGFLFFNWSPAKVFMGDVGSTFLGAVFAGLVLQSPSWSEAFGFLLVATPLLGDACFCVLRRFFAGQRVFEAHRLHLFQCLHQVLVLEMKS